MESFPLQVKDAPLIPHFLKLKRSSLVEGMPSLPKKYIKFCTYFQRFGFLTVLKYFIYYMFQVLHFIFLHSNFWFICQNLYPHLFVIWYSSTILAYFIYEYIIDKKWFQITIHYIHSLNITLPPNPKVLLLFWQHSRTWRSLIL